MVCAARRGGKQTFTSRGPHPAHAVANARSQRRTDKMMSGWAVCTCGREGRRADRTNREGGGEGW